MAEIKTERVENQFTEFKIGDKVTCPSEFGDEVLTVVDIVHIGNSRDIQLALHDQWIIAERQGTRLPSKSGYYFRKAE